MTPDPAVHGVWLDEGLQADKGCKEGKIQSSGPAAGSPTEAAPDGNETAATGGRVAGGGVPTVGNEGKHGGDLDFSENPPKVSSLGIAYGFI
jgi:hypothetical protein